MNDRRQYYLEVARLHREGIKLGFLSTLGEEFLALLYDCLDEAPEAVLLTEVSNGRVIGFISGAYSLGPIYKRMLMKLPQLIIALAPVLATPTKLFQIAELLKHNFSSSKTTADGRPLPEFELLSLAVASNERRSGVAHRLYSRLEEYARENSVEAFKIVVGADLESAHKFYLSMGALPTSDVYIHDNKKSLIYVQSV